VHNRVTTVRFVFMFQSMELLNINSTPVQLVRCWLIENADGRRCIHRSVYVMKSGRCNAPASGLASSKDN
jgi:hypothetical protein